MRRSIQYTGAKNRGFDFAAGFQDVENAIGNAIGTVLGEGGTPLVQGLAVTNPSGTTVLDIGAGTVFQAVEQDPSATGAIPADNEIILAAGQMGASSINTSPPTSTGQSVVVLVTAAVVQLTAIRGNDPEAGLLNYYDASGAPLVGPGGNGQTQPDYIYRGVSINVVYGTPATTGSQVAPALPAGQVLVATLRFDNGATEYGSIVMAQAFNGLLNSHHTGAVGQAPRINIGTEIAASDNLGQIQAVQLCGGNPNGLVQGYSAGSYEAGSPPSFCWDTLHGVMWYCTASGTAATSQWAASSSILLGFMSGYGGFNTGSNPTLAVTAGNVILPGAKKAFFQASCAGTCGGHGNGAAGAGGDGGIGVEGWLGPENVPSWAAGAVISGYSGQGASAALTASAASTAAGDTLITIGATQLCHLIPGTDGALGGSATEGAGTPIASVAQMIAGLTQHGGEIGGVGIDSSVLWIGGKGGRGPYGSGAQQNNAINTTNGGAQGANGTEFGDGGAGGTGNNPAGSGNGGDWKMWQFS